MKEITSEKQLEVYLNNKLSKNQTEGQMEENEMVMAALKLQFSKEQDYDNLKRDIMQNMTIAGCNQLRSRQNMRRVVNTQISSNNNSVS